MPHDERRASADWLELVRKKSKAVTLPGRSNRGARFQGDSN